jgi:hypothetical protein
VLRIRWSDPEDSGASSPDTWKYAAWIWATISLNIAFWLLPAPDLFASPPLRFGGIPAITSLLIVALFSLGPALAAQAAGQPLFRAVESSLGSIPAWGVRLAAWWFLMVWISTMVWIPSSWWLPSILRRPVSPVESRVAAVAMLTFVLITSFQSLRARAKAASFSSKLGVAILLAAAIRVRAGWPAAFHDTPDGASSLPLVDVWHGLSMLGFYIGPVVFLSAGLVHRVQQRKQLFLAVGLGILLPLCGTLLVLTVIRVATYPAGYGQPGLPPNVTMALWNNAAAGALPARMTLAAITLFGALRFCVSAVSESASVPALQGWLKWLPTVCVLAASVWVADQPGGGFGLRGFETAGACLTAVAAVLTADFLVRRQHQQQARTVDWVGLTALLAGLATPFLLSPRSDSLWWYTWMLPSYGAAFAVAISGRRLQRAAGKHRDARLTERG